MLWNDLSTKTKTAVAKMVEYEANRFNSYTVPYWANKNGTIIYPGDTKAEENDWNSRVLVAAYSMMPNHPNKNKWKAKASELMISAYSRQSDLNNSTSIDGKQVKRWLIGFNVFPDGVLVNHDFVHPDYVVSDSVRYTTAVDRSLANKNIPQSTFFNANLAYSALTEVNFTPGPSPYSSGDILAPGGTMLHKTQQGDYDAYTYYPQGADWTTYISDGYLNTDMYAEVMGWDAGKSFDALGWARAHVDELMYLQNRGGHQGNVYGDNDWLADYRGTEPLIFESITESWMIWWLKQHNMVSPVSASW